MSVNTNWARWIFASVSKHFDDRKSTLPLFIEGQHRATRDLKDYLELRMDGPRWLEVNRGCWTGRVEINILVSSAFDEKDYHRIHRYAGLVQNAFTRVIEAFRFGDGPDDDQSFLGCLILQQNRGRRDFLELNHFGRITPEDALTQSSVEGHYEIELTT